MINIAFITSGSGSTLKYLCELSNRGCLDAKIDIVITDRKCKALEIASDYSVDCYNMDFPLSTSSDLVSKKIKEILDSRSIDLIFLAFNRLITSPLIEEYNNKIINAHPSLLPAYKGFGAINETMKTALFGGCSIHVCTKEADAGPLIIQSVIPMEDYSQTEYQQLLFDRQKKNIAQAIQWYADGRVENNGMRVRIKNALYKSYPNNPAHDKEWPE